ncbi:MAG: glycoside hydrolase family 16 protein [Verrucomicrobiota bacterium]|jgi:beta-glucanase (GH16 family)
MRIAIVIAVLFAYGALGGILVNPGFESDGSSTTTAGWNTYGANVYSQTSATLAHTGTNYLKVYQQFNGAINYSGVYQDHISGVGAVYAADGWAYTLSSDVLAGQNVAWIEVTFRDAAGNVLALYRSALITTNAIASRGFPTNAWTDLRITNQYDPNTYSVTNYTAALVAPPGTSFVRYQITFQGDAAYSNGSVYFDDLNLTQTAGGPQGNWNIVWSDEFNGTAINTNVWTYDLGNNGGWGNNELEYYTSSPQNAYVSNGLLHIVALQQSTNGYSYTSARMKTEGLYAAEYGRFEFRASLPAGAGFWPALWMLGTNITSVGWPACGEIDVMENNGSFLTNVQGSLHSGSDETQVYTLPGGSVTNFHRYVLEWTTNAINWYVDGLLYETQTSWSSSVWAYPAPFNQPFFLIMNVAVGGEFIGNPSIATINSNSIFPGQMQVDYVRRYDLTTPLELAVAGGGGKVSLTWPSNIVCHLESAATLGAKAAWTAVTDAAPPYPVSLSSSTVFYRLVSP